MLNSEEIKPIALAVIELHLSEGISQIVSQSFLTNAIMLSESKYLADFLGGFLGKKPQTLLIPIYNTTVLYD